MNLENKQIDLAAVCGLYCGICTKYENKTCGGCHSNAHFSNHKGCDIYKCCVEEKKLRWCFQCDDFPCKEIVTFTKWSSWISHKDCIKNLNRMKEVGVDKWLEEKEAYRK